MKKSSKFLVTAGAAIGVVALVAGIATAGSGGDDNEVPINGVDLDRASAVALKETGEGRVTETEVGDEESFYEVEVTLGSGAEVDVQLDKQFNVVGSETDDKNEEGGADD